MNKIRGAAASALYGVRQAFDSRFFWVCLLGIAVSAVLAFLSVRLHLVYIHDRGEILGRYTLCRSADEILVQNGVGVGEYDEVLFNGFTGRIGVLEIRRAFPVTITVDGGTRNVMTTAKPLSELLEQEGIELGEYDRITPSPQTLLAAGTSVKISRVSLETTVETEEIPYETVYRSSSLLKAGRSRTIVAGAAGERTYTYLDRIVDGELQTHALMKTETTREPQAASVLIGSEEAVSPLDFGVALDENGIPLQYTRVLRNQICTGYSGRGRTVRGASGMRLSAGSVAVRSDEIPYGTRMYIVSSDGGGFVYGCAVAADTGVALQQNVIDFDLFYDTYLESRLNGRRICDVYLLD